MRLFDELKRRKVIRVGVAYLALSWLLLQVAETLLPAYGYTDAAIRNLVTVLAMGLVLALVLAWVFDWTPQGVQKTAAIGEGEAQRSARAPNAVIAMIVLVAAGAAAFLAYRSLAEVPRSERTIAVLPFATLGRDEADVFTDGMHLGVLTRLSEIHELDVISRTSAMRLRGSNMSLPEIADQLGADWVLNAEVQKGNEEVLVSVRLADARMDRQVWAENYRRTLTAAFEDLDEGYRLLDALEVWPDWPTLAFIHHHEGVWNPQGNDPRYTATRLRINESWGLPPGGLP